MVEKCITGANTMDYLAEVSARYGRTIDPLPAFLPGPFGAEYATYYIDGCGQPLCHECADRRRDKIVAHFQDYEGRMTCENCYERIDDVARDRIRDDD